MKRRNWSNYVYAFEVYYGQYYSIDPCEVDETHVLEGWDINPERALMKCQAYESLSAEAKEMIGTILNAPDEVLELLTTPKQNGITRATVRQDFSVIWNSKFITNLTIREISKWINQL